MKTYQINIENIPSDEVAFIKAVRVIGNMNLKTALSLYKYFSVEKRGTIAAGIELALATYMADSLRKSGFDVTVEESTVRSPLLCMPGVNVKYEWGEFRNVVKA